MVVDDVKDDAYASAVEGLYHLFEFAYAHVGAGGIGAVAAFGDVVVEGVVAPVVLWTLGVALVDGVVVVAREYLYGVDAEGLEIPDVVGLGQGKVFAWISAAS